MPPLGSWLLALLALGSQSQPISRFDHLTSVPFFVYIAADSYGSLHVGVTNDLARRIGELRLQYPIRVRGLALEPIRLVYYEVISTLPKAVYREQQLKTWKRGRKKRLVNAVNPEWRDLTDAA